MRVQRGSVFNIAWNFWGLLFRFAEKTCMTNQAKKVGLIFSPAQNLDPSILKGYRTSTRLKKRYSWCVNNISFSDQLQFSNEIDGGCVELRTAAMMISE